MILIAAAVLSVSVGEPIDALFIAAVIGLNACIGAIQEWKASRQSLALQKLIYVSAMVHRDGQIVKVDAKNLVPGDIIFLESGIKVPADARLISTHSARIDESLLTGESIPVTKYSDSLCEPDTPLSDRCNMVFAGSTMISGRATGIVVATGHRAAVGQLAISLTVGGSGEAPLIVRMRAFTKHITYVIGAFALALLFIGTVGIGLPAEQVFLMTIALAVSAIPEGLPVAMTVALSVATRRMSKRNVIVRKLAAVESLGSCDFIASDKTGTLTCNQMTVRTILFADERQFHVSGTGYIPTGHIFKDDSTPLEGEDQQLLSLARHCILCNEAELYLKDDSWHWRGDPVDISLLTLALKIEPKASLWLTQYPRTDQIPYEPEHAYSASFHEDPSNLRRLALVKGAPELITSMCMASTTKRALVLKKAEALAQKGLRVIAMAQKTMPLSSESHAPTGSPASELFDFELLGLVGIEDPPREGVKDAIKRCKSAGIKVAMLTGDHAITAFRLAKELGIASNEKQVITGTELAKLSGPALIDIMPHTFVFARTSPAQKLAIIKAAQAASHFVAVTGDGVNDAPALRMANVGIAMGRSGTDIARDASDLVISDDHFASIVSGIEEGRIAYDNIRKVILLLITTGLGEIIMVSLAIVSGLPIPLLPAQLLWLNLVTNGIQDIALAFERGEKSILVRKPRPSKEAIFNQIMIEQIVGNALVMGIMSWWLFATWLENGVPIDQARSQLLSLMVLFEIVHIGNCRSETSSAFRISPFKSPLLLLGSASALSVHIGSMYWPFLANILAIQPITPAIFATLLLYSLSLLVSGELIKLRWSLKRKDLAKLPTY